MGDRWGGGASEVIADTYNNGMLPDPSIVMMLALWFGVLSIPVFVFFAMKSLRWPDNSFGYFLLLNLVISNMTNRGGVWYQAILLSLMFIRLKSMRLAVGKSCGHV
ncbi:hypothetical protein Ptc2401_00837 [Prosthecochloris sp. CIB 2401]|nr:hypothetical protein Ptc2401_00837 [Prosthecochloris sp. CIB 2401]